MSSEEELKRFGKTTYYQTIVYQRLQDIIIDRECKLIRGCEQINEKWKDVKRYLSSEQKKDLNNLVKLYGKNRRKRVHRATTRIAASTPILK